jgi:integrase
LPTTKLTQIAVERLKAPASGRIEYFDTQLPAFGLRISASGRKSWIAMYRVNGKLVRETLGSLARIPKVENARERARESMRQAQAGVHPVEVRREAEVESAAHELQTFGAVADLFVARYARPNTRPITCAETERIIERELKPSWGARPIREIGRRDIVELLDRLIDRGAPVQANRALAHLRRILNWARERDIVDINPGAGMRMPTAEVQRDRVLSDHEVKLFWYACGDIGWPFGPMFKLLLLTAQRRSEVAGMRWSELSLTDRQWVIPRERAKNDREHAVHLCGLSIEIVQSLPRFVRDAAHGDGKAAPSDLVFTTTGTTAVSGISKAKERLDDRMLEQYRAKLADAVADTKKTAAIGEWTPHDLRRTAATGMARLNVAPHVVDRILNHVSGTIHGVAAIYNRHAYLNERQAALEAWGQYIENLVRP